MLSSIEKVSKILAAIALPFILLYLGNDFTASLKDKDIHQKYVEIAVGILTNEPTEETKELRSWAVQVINRYAEIKIDAKLESILVDQTALPSSALEVPRKGFRTVEGKRQIKRIIVSDTQQDNTQAELAALDNHGVSYHYLIDLDGSVMKLVDENNIAFHTTRQNDDSIGIGVMHRSGETYTDAQKASLKRLITEIATRYAIAKSNILAKSEVSNKRSDFNTIKESVLTDLAP
jgi:Negative regulator of beta-lactamase expression